jgi:aminopeptidase N
MPNPIRPAAIAAGLLLASAASLLAQQSGRSERPDTAIAEDPRIDSRTGRELANYNPPNHFLIRHTRLEMDILDMTTPEFGGVLTLTAEAVGKPRSQLVLDAGRDITIQSISQGTREQKFAHDPLAGKLTIDLDRPIPAGTRTEVVVRYTAKCPRANGKGLTWTQGRTTAKSDTDRWAQIHSQGEPQDNSTWIPCHDFPNQRATTELIVTVEDGYIVGSNGHLVGTRLGSPSASGRPRTTWHWLQDKPHSSYLISLVVGHFAIVGLPSEEPPINADGKATPCYLYVPHGTEANAAKVYAKTPAILSAFGRRFGTPYPWDKYSQACVRRFAMGGMENTSATTMPDTSASMQPGRWDEVIAHEAAHQWFGDLVTCKSWEHIWLNEGWATFSEAIWAEADAAKGREQRAYQRVIAGKLAGQRAMNRTYAPNFPAMVSKRWGDPFEAFIRPNDAYAKGGVVLHMLRQKLGDDAFFAGVRNYLGRFAFTQAETDDFRRCLEDASGLSLERFFEQWCYRPGMPRLKVEMDWQEDSPGAEGSDSGAGTLTLRFKQTQRIDAANPAYAFRVPIYLKFESDGRFVWIDMDSREAQGAFRLPAKPSDITIDPQMTIAAPTAIDKPLAMWLEQLRDDRSPAGTVFARLQAAEHLAAFPDSLAVAALAAAAIDNSIDEPVRRAAARGVAEQGARAAITLLLNR